MRHRLLRRWWVGLALVLLLAGGMAVYALRAPRALRGRLARWDASMAVPAELSITEFEKRKLGRATGEFVVAESPGRLVRLQRITGLGEPEASDYIRDERRKIVYVYEPSASPYFMNVTRVNACPDEFKPTFYDGEDEGRRFSVAIMYANERLSYGVCSRDAAAYRFLAGYVYCKRSSSVFAIEYFVRLGTFSEQDAQAIRGFRCR